MQVTYENNMGFCRGCGKQSGHEDRFCTGCGTPIIESKISVLEDTTQIIETWA